MNLETLKNTYAQEQGYEDWDEMFQLLGKSVFDHFNDEFLRHENTVIILAEKAALEKAADNSWINGNEFSRCGCEIDRTLITNPENLIL